MPRVTSLETTDLVHAIDLSRPAGERDVSIEVGNIQEAASVVDHGALGGLADDDHPQYAAVAQAEAISALWNFTSFIPELPNASPTTQNQATRKKYVDDQIDGSASAHTGAYDHTKLHDRAHALDSADHTGIAATEDNFLAADAGGLPKDSGYAPADFAADDHVHAGGTHNRLHDIDSTDDHTGVVGAAEDDFMAFDANGLPKDSGKDAADFAEAAHSHTEADISDLDHNAQKIDDLPADLTGMTAGQAIVMNVTEDGLEPGTAGGGTHERLHDINDALDHNPIAGIFGNFLILDENGYPADSGYEDGSFAASGHTHPGGTHDRLHQINDPLDHDGLASFIENNFMGIDADGLFKDSGYAPGSFAASGHTHAGVYAPIGEGVTGGDSHDHYGGDGGQIDYTRLGSLPTLGTAAAKNIPASGDAAVGEVVYGTDTRLLDARTPVAHNHSANAITSDTLDGDRLPALSQTKKGGAPATGVPSGKYLKDDGTWATPAGGGITQTQETNATLADNASLTVAHVADTTHKRIVTGARWVDPVATDYDLTFAAENEIEQEDVKGAAVNCEVDLADNYCHFEDVSNGILRVGTGEVIAKIQIGTTFFLTGKANAHEIIAIANTATASIPFTTESYYTQFDVKQTIYELQVNTANASGHFHDSAHNVVTIGTGNTNAYVMAGCRFKVTGIATIFEITGVTTDGSGVNAVTFTQQDGNAATELTPTGNFVLDWIYGTEFTAGQTALNLSGVAANGVDANCVLMCHCEGADASTTLTDSSASAHSSTAGGNAQIDTADKKWGSACALFDGTGDYFSFPDSDNWDICASNADNWTIDFWVRLDAHADAMDSLMTHFAASNKHWEIYHIHGSGLAFGVWNAPTNIIMLAAGGEITDSNWHHVALCKVGSLYAIYKDGVQVNYLSDADTFNVTGLLYIGYRGDEYGIQGAMDEIRIYHGNWFNASPNVGKTNTITVPTGPYYPSSTARPITTIYPVTTTDLSQISLVGVAHITGFTVTETVPVTCAVYYLLSWDGRVTWTAYDATGGNAGWRPAARNNGGTWQYNSNVNPGYSSVTWTNAAINSQEGAIRQAAAAYTSNSIESTALNALDQAKIEGTGGFNPGVTVSLNFCSCLYSGNNTVTPSVDNLTVAYTTVIQRVSIVNQDGTAADIDAGVYAVSWARGTEVIGGNFKLNIADSKYPLNQFYGWYTTNIGRTDTTSLTDISADGFTITETLNSQTHYIVVSYDDRVTWRIYDATGGNTGWRPVVWNDSGTWKYNSNASAGYSNVTWTGATINTYFGALEQAVGVAANRMNGTAFNALTAAQIKGTGGWSVAVDYINYGGIIKSTSDAQTPVIGDIKVQGLPAGVWEPFPCDNSSVDWATVYHDDTTVVYNYSGVTQNVEVTVSQVS